MSGAALTLVLAAAALHAVWNLLIAGAPDTRRATALALVSGCVVLAPFAAVTWRVGAAALPFAAASAAFELAYFALLARAYERDDMSAVYPLARGSAPVIVLLVTAAAGLGTRPSWLQGAGVMIIAGGVVAVRGVQLHGWAAGLQIGACIAGYTVCDSFGVRHAAPLAYLELTMAAPALCYLVAIRRIPTGFRDRGGAALAGVFTIAAYGLVLAALRVAPVAAAVRESSVVLGVLLAAVVLRETVRPARVVGAVLVVAGIATAALG